MTDKPALKWVSEDCTESAVYLTEFDAVRYSYPSKSEDGAPIFRSVLIDLEAARGITGLFLKGEPDDRQAR